MLLDPSQLPVLHTISVWLILIWIKPFSIINETIERRLGLIKIAENFDQHI
jgi:hypothetical protein